MPRKRAARRPETRTDSPASESDAGTRRTERSREAWAEFAGRCLKPGATGLGNLYARFVVRPAALRVTRRLIPLGISAHAMTGLALLTAILAALCFGSGSPTGWCLGIVLLQLWYLLDHVDGQLARWHGTASLDGTALDYLMHHAVNLLVPLGVGYALEPTWPYLGCGLGFVWGFSLWAIGVREDVRCKAFLKRLKRLRGELTVVGGGAGRPTPPRGLPLDPAEAVRWFVRKSCEVHVWMNLLTLWTLFGSWMPWVGGYGTLLLVSGLTLTAATTATWLTVRGLRDHEAEAEFDRWYLPPPGFELVEEGGWWELRRRYASSRSAETDPPAEDEPFEPDTVESPSAAVRSGSARE